MHCRGCASARKKAPAAHGSRARRTVVAPPQKSRPHRGAMPPTQKPSLPDTPGSAPAHNGQLLMPVAGRCFRCLHCNARPRFAHRQALGLPYLHTLTASPPRRPKHSPALQGTMRLLHLSSSGSAKTRTCTALFAVARLSGHGPGSRASNCKVPARPLAAADASRAWRRNRRASCRCPQPGRPPRALVCQRHGASARPRLAPC